MIRKRPPFPRVDFDRPMPEIAHVDPVEPEPGRARRESACRPSPDGGVDFLQAAVMHQPAVGELAPVVEVASDDEGRIAGQVVRDEPEQPVDLPLAMRLPQGEMQADRVQRPAAVRQSDHGVQQPPRFREAHGYVDVAPGIDRISGEDRIPVMSARPDGIASIGMLGPDAVREDLVLLHGRLSARDGSNLLEEYEIRLRGTQGIADAQKGLLPAARTEALARVQGQYADPGFHTLTPSPGA